MTRAVVFAYHDVGVRCLGVLLAQGVDVAHVYTHRDDPNENIWFGSVAELAHLHGVPCTFIDRADAPELATSVAANKPDFLFSFYYRFMLTPEILALAPHGAFNMHGSLLPKYRGRVPVNWAIIHGERETGATLHEMVAKPDAGRLVDQLAVPILPNDTALDVFRKVTVAAEIVLHRALPRLRDGSAVLTTQDLSAGNYHGGRKPADGQVHWQWPAAQVHNLIRAVAPPYPGAFCLLQGRRLDLLGTLDLGERTPITGQPLLYIDGDQLRLRCNDGGVLRLTQTRYDGAPLTAAHFQSLFSGTAVALEDS